MGWGGVPVTGCPFISSPSTEPPVPRRWVVAGPLETWSGVITVMPEPFSFPPMRILLRIQTAPARAPAPVQIGPRAAAWWIHAVHPLGLPRPRGTPSGAGNTGTPAGRPSPRDTSGGIPAPRRKPCRADVDLLTLKFPSRGGRPRSVVRGCGAPGCGSACHHRRGPSLPEHVPQGRPRNEAATLWSVS